MGSSLAVSRSATQEECWTTLFPHDYTDLAGTIVYVNVHILRCTWSYTCMYVPETLCANEPEIAHVQSCTSFLAPHDFIVHEKIRWIRAKRHTADSCFKLVGSHQHSPVQLTLGSTRVYICTCMHNPLLLRLFLVNVNANL